MWVYKRAKQGKRNRRLRVLANVYKKGVINLRKIKSDVSYHRAFLKISDVRL